MYQLEIISLIGMGLGALLSLVSVLPLPISPRQRAFKKINQSPSDRGQQLDMKKNPEKRVYQVIEQIRIKEENSKRSEEEALSLFLARN